MRIRTFLAAVAAIAMMVVSGMPSAHGVHCGLTALRTYATNIENLPQNIQARHDQNTSGLLPRFLAFARRQSLDGLVAILQAPTMAGVPDYRLVMQYLAQNPRLLTLPEVRAALPEILCRHGFLDDKAYLASLRPAFSRARVDFNQVLTQAQQEAARQRIIESIEQTYRFESLANDISLAPAAPGATRVLPAPPAAPGFHLPVLAEGPAKRDLEAYLREYIPRRVYSLREPLALAHGTMQEVSSPFDVNYNRRSSPERRVPIVHGGFGIYTTPLTISNGLFGNIFYRFDVPPGARVFDSHTARNLFAHIRSAYADFINAEAARLVSELQLDDRIARHTVEVDIAWELTGRPDIILGDGFPDEVIIRNPEIARQHRRVTEH